MPAAASQTEAEALPAVVDPSTRVSAVADQAALLQQPVAASPAGAEHDARVRTAPAQAHLGGPAASAAADASPSDATAAQESAADLGAAPLEDAAAAEHGHDGTDMAEPALRNSSGGMRTEEVVPSTRDLGTTIIPAGLNAGSLAVPDPAVQVPQD